MLHLRMAQVSVPLGQVGQDLAQQQPAGAAAPLAQQRPELTAAPLARQAAGLWWLWVGPCVVGSSLRKRQG
jgi:hypothetical protein